ncbi:hypothetical protein [Actinoallomurus sp. NPDC052274]|uniref:hypothetical protein n=1 Tax=Actinoallomurus sp. NPDC052274 TaxID=3155420 RepID=UPI00343F8E99
MAVVAVLIIVGAVAIVLVSRGDGKKHPVAAPTTPYVAPTPTPTPSGRFPPVVPGWQVVVASEKNGLSYDVPADWTVNDEDTSIGLDDGSAMPETTVSFSAKSEKDKCTLGGAGFKSTDVDNLRASATQAARGSRAGRSVPVRRGEACVRRRTERSARRAGRRFWWRPLRRDEFSSQ